MFPPNTPASGSLRLLTLPFRAHRQEELRLLSYNVWFNEGVRVAERMRAIGRIIAARNPHVVCLQEVTPNIMRLLAADRSWWDRYEVACSEPATLYFTLLLVAKGHLVAAGSRQSFRNATARSRMGRDLAVARVRFRGKELAVATSHLESYEVQTKKSHAKERTAQFREALEVLQKTPSGKNAIFVGDMNWDEKTDGEMQFPPGFRDAWRALHPDDPGFTYDTKRNTMLLDRDRGGTRRLQKRLDRAVVSLTDFELRSVQLVGTEKLPGVTYQKERMKQGQPYWQEMDVLPSDHFGLLLTLKLRPPKKGQTSVGRQTLGTAAPGSAADNPVDLSD